ncbi:hypothetical protein GCM10010441_78210 [Kitasatospora paracochleata]|uniref:Uncharacterized membrane protein YozB (DUF420 family) n=1 Tax=Kitasatospora paracochleata TaxID=58354 RepID=A0ABT1IT37_9ACTN|nr:DUF2306 domain-containing protein [Kitasatospora paracochleata]MCP2308297.1 uncharacterized membrane protein YozB (DUF420 family) [Kitasatospora paracochleata]
MTARRQWWVALFALYCIGFALYGADPYLSFNQAHARIFPPRSPVQYPLIVAHVFTGVVAVSLAWVQVWPRLRARRPKLHRSLGRVYLMAGVFPAGLLAIPTAVLDTGGQSIRLALLTIDTLWLFTGVLGWTAAVKRRYQDHRRWMLRNVALTTVIVTARPFAFANLFLMHWINPTAYSLTSYHSHVTFLNIGLWGSLAFHLVLVEWVVLSRRPFLAGAGLPGTLGTPLATAGAGTDDQR